MDTGTDHRFAARISSPAEVDRPIAQRLAWAARQRRCPLVRILRAHSIRLTIRPS